MRKALSFMFIVFSWTAPGQAETVRLIAEDDWYPYSAKSEDGTPHGIAVDLVQAAFEAQGMEVELDVMNYDLCMERVKDGEAVGCFDAPRTREVEDAYLWHDDKLFSANAHFYAAAGSGLTINDLSEAAGKKVGLTQGYGYGDIVDMDKGMIKEYSKSDSILVKKLIAKRLDLIILFDKVADYLLPKLGVFGKLEQAGHADSVDIYVAFSKSHPDGARIRDVFSAGLRKIQDNGSYKRILDEWDAKLPFASPRVALEEAA